MRKILIISLGLMFMSMVAINKINSGKAVVTENITLLDGKEYVLKQPLGDCWCCVHHSGNVLGFSASILPPTPLVIKSFETKITPFNVLMDYAFDAFSEPCSYSLTRGALASSNKFLVYRANENANIIDFPLYNINLNGGRHNAQTSKIIDAWDYGSDYMLPFFHQLMKSSSVRKELFNYVTKSFNRASSYYPVSVKKNMIMVLDDLILFIDNYQKNRYKYKNAAYLVNDIGFYRAFVYRRIENDRIPRIELKQYIVGLRKTISSTLTGSPLKSLLNVTINRELVIVDDKGGWLITSTKSGKNIIVKTLNSIKCLRSEGKNYYIIKTENKEVLVSSTLSVVNRN